MSVPVQRRSTSRPPPPRRSPKPSRPRAHLTRSEILCLLRIGQIASSATDPRSAAAETLELFRHIVPYAAASISAWSPVTDRHQTIANASYPPGVVTHLDTWFVHHDEVYALMRNVDPTPLRWKDMPFDYRRLYSAREVFIPVGFDEGVTTCLYTPDGRYTGSFHVSTDTRRHPSDAAMGALAVLQTTLAGLADALRAPCWIAASRDPAEAVGIITADAEVVALPGYPLGAHLAAGAPLVRTVSDLLRSGRPLLRFLWQDECGGWYRVLLEPNADGAVGYLAPTVLPLDLTSREVDVLTVMAEGRSNAQIAAALVVSPRTVAKHVEHVLRKLKCTSRSGAVARAIGEGLLRRPVPAPAPVEPARRRATAPPGHASCIRL